MLAHDARFLRIELAALEEDGIGDGNLADVVEEAAALERAEVAVVEPERRAQFRRVVREPLTVAVGRRIARLDGGAEAENHRLGRFQLVGVAFQPDE